MRHGNKINKLGRTSAHRKALLRNLAIDLFDHGYIATTLAKAKELKPFAEKIITKAVKVHKAETFGRRITLSREIEKNIHQYEVYLKLINVWGMLCLNRQGGYLRIIKMGTRKGDNSEMAYIGIVLNEGYRDATTYPGIAFKSMFNNLSTSLIDNHLLNKNLLTQWYHATMPQIDMDGTLTTTTNRKIIRFKIQFHGVDLEDVNWPVFNSRYVDLPVSLHLYMDADQMEIEKKEGEERESPGKNLAENKPAVKYKYEIKSEDHFTMLPSYNEKNIIKLLVPPLKDSRTVEGEVVIEKNEDGSLPRLDYCYLTIRGPISDIYIFNFLKKKK
ncbi:50S ribosomal protein L17 [Chitinophaga ginsengisoli]|uniref:50S ribosomal protein L17 n=1 Tax=Chitinophaga ginsengisoli TaxID=363837 RepID=A0A2P8FF39_9BACT|nr:50S ribosomal protein L17 [Chitinophaga ginsengisoli]PSL20304.1 ribosomal protein L17 [Chitinophaga ginsengisoli]